MHKKARKLFAEYKQTKDMDYWNHVLWSDETKINLFGSDGVKRVWRQPGEEYKDKCVMVWGCMSTADMYCDILKQSMNPSLQRLGRRAVFQQNDHCLAKEAEGNCDRLAKHVSRPKPYWASLNGTWRSTRYLTSTSSMMSSWRRGRGLQWQPVNLWWTREQN